MCGVFLLSYSKRRENIELEKDLSTIIEESSLRGRDALGLIFLFNKKMYLFKENQDPLIVIKSKKFKDFMNSIKREDITNELHVIGQCRLATSNFSVDNSLNQPIETENLIGVFNGVLNSYTDQNGLIKNTYLEKIKNDTDQLFQLLEQENISSNNYIEKLNDKITGVLNLIIFNKKMNQIDFYTNNGSLYKSTYNNEFTLYASDEIIIDHFSKRRDLKIKSFIQLKGQSSIPITNMDVYGLHKIINKPTLKRCSKCVLPITYPLIKFNKDGVCNYCTHYKIQQVHGEDALNRKLDPHRSKDGSADCLVGFSGGRDSSYGLHLLKTKFGMNPIAYTFDWGLTTEIARRNQSVMCGKLGIEHIIRSADLEKNRRHVRKNINAWLKQPHLGMVPLFQAGDKDFFEYGRTIRDDLGLKLSINCSGFQYEQREFMVGFTGIEQPEMFNNPDFFHHPTSTKIKLAIWYCLQYLKNPRYLNESFYASIRSYCISFFKKTDFLYLFHYLPWDESEIDQFLKDEYHWESDSSFGNSQWRMGDGHTAFINFIYQQVAGLSEFDSFRSHQVRCGVMTRDQALASLAFENKPKYESIKEFCILVGLPFEEVIKKIQRINTLY